MSTDVWFNRFVDLVGEDGGDLSELLRAVYEHECVPHPFVTFIPVD